MCTHRYLATESDGTASTIEVPFVEAAEVDATTGMQEAFQKVVGLSMEIRLADLDRIVDQRAIEAMLAAYAIEPSGNGEPLPGSVMAALIPGLQELPTSRVFLAWDGATPVGMGICFLGYSTFMGKKTLNIHDLVVIASHRGQGIGGRLLAAIESQAGQWGVGKITMEVLEHNRPARSLYHRAGFSQVQGGPGFGGTLFYQKKIAAQA
jgi:GNAT superfamily N-acetyltransferase